MYMYLITTKIRDASICGYDTTSIHLYIKIMLYITIKNMIMYNIKTVLKTL